MRVDMLDRLRIDPGSRTIGELIQERQWALQEIERLRTATGAARDARGTIKAQPTPVAQREPAVVDAAPTSAHLLRMSDVIKLVGLSRSTVYKMIERGEFPAGVHAGVRARRWRMAEVASWQD